MTSPLEGIRVVDLTRVLAGPLCTMMLGDFGADVIKVESPQGDETRSWGPPYVGGESAYYLGVNGNKRGIVLDLSGSAGRGVLARLLSAADVAVDNFKTGTLARWGFDDSWFSEHAPQLVRCSVTGYGTHGPRAMEPGYDFVLQAETGLMSITGVGETPTKHGVAIVDVLTGHHAVIAILAALRARESTGSGQQVSVSLFHSGLSLLANVASNFLISGRTPGRYGNGHPNIVPYRIFETSDDAIALAVGNDAQFHKLSIIADSPQWTNDDRLATNDARVRHRDYADGVVAASFTRHPASWWIERLRAAGIPCGRVNDVPAALEDPQGLALGVIAEIDHPVAGIVRQLASPLTMTETPIKPRSAAPTFGEHTDVVLKELGCDDVLIRELRRSGAFGPSGTAGP